MSGKKQELPVKRLFQGWPVSKVINLDAIANPEVIPWYTARALAWLERSEVNGVRDESRGCWRRIDGAAVLAPRRRATLPRPVVPRVRTGLVLGMLCFVYVLNFLDRQLISILAKPIQDGLHITDSQLGLLTGFYFALFYCFIAVPIGWLADRTNRVRVLSIACALWSGATAACGMAGNYAQLVIARMTVGVGEAGGVPPSYAIISDYFPRERRGRAMAIFNLGPPLGSALGVAFGASLAAAFNWRLPFYVIGASEC